MNNLQVILLGRFAVQLNGAAVEIPPRASQSLFAYLALNRDTFHRREMLAGMFWPDSSETNARSNLRQALWQIRSGIGQDIFVADKVTVSLDPEIEIEVDADRLLVDATASMDETLEAADLYHGDLLPGFYDDWVILERERLREAFGRLMERLLEGLIAEMRWEEVSDWAGRWIALGHVPEPAFRALMVAHAARGDQAGVESVYQRCVDTLERELGVEPSGQTLLLREQLLEGKLPDAAAPSAERYELGEEIGRGGMGEVYRAQDTWLEREVAVKLLSSEALGREGRERLLAEAQAAARLNHPNVVSVYDVGEREGQPFIVMELVEGETLHERRPEEQAEALSIALEICAALEHAHAQGVIHRDLKPENVMLAPDGMARLMDFGLASRTVETPEAPEGGTAGTVYYLAPEVLKGEPAGVQSDLYALGVMLYELLTGELPFQGENPMAVITQHLEAEPKPPSEFNPEIRPALEALILRLLSKNPTDRPLSAAAVAEVLEAVAPEEVQLGEPAPGEPPFKGLEYYDVDDADIFFGREALVERLLDRLKGERFLAVIVGASGSGKSSIARAGLVPALQGQDSGWVFRVMMPTERPLVALSEALTPDKDSETETAPSPEELAGDPSGLHHAAQWLVETEGAEKLLLVVDQLEELFTLCDDEAERAAIIDNLLRAADPDTKGPTTVVITLRADFYPHCAAYPALRDALARNQEYIGPMDTAELRRAIEEPALRGGWKFQSGLVDLMLRDVRGEPGALPLLSHALLETWKRRSRRTLTLRGYAEAGGVRRAIARTAEHVYHQLLDEAQRAIACSLFLRLTELGEGTEDTRRRVTHRELIPDPGQNGITEQVLATLAEARLITLSEEYVEVAHEALIREWPRLREWLDEDREGLRIHRHLTEAAQAWEALEQDPGELYRGGRLAQALEWSDEQHPDLNPLEREFLESSQALAEQREAERAAQLKRLRRRAVYLVGALVVAVGLGIAAASFGAQANRSAEQADRSLSTAQVANTETAAEALNRATAEAVAIEERQITEDQLRITRSRELAAAAMNNLDVDPELSALLAIEALKVERTGEAESALHNAVGKLRLAQIFDDTIDGSEPFTIAYSPDGSYIATGSTNGEISIWDPEIGREVASWTAHEDFIEEVEFSADGMLLASASTDSRSDYLKVWDLSPLADGRPGVLLHNLVGHTAGVWDVAFTPDGKQLASISDDGTTRLWDIFSGEELMQIPEGTYAVDIPLTGGILATASQGVKIRSLETGRELLTLPGYSESGDISMIRFSPDGQLLATGGYDGVLKMWEVVEDRSGVTANLVFSVPAHANQFFGLAFNSDASVVATGGQDGLIKVWDASTGSELFTIGSGSGAVNEVAFDPTCSGPPEAMFAWCGRYLASTIAASPIKLWEASPAGGRELVTLPGFWGLFIPSTSNIATWQFSRDGADADLWRIPGVSPSGAEGPPVSADAGFVDSFYFDWGHRPLAGGGGRAGLSTWVFDDLTAQVSNLETGQVASEFQLDLQPFNSQLSSDGKLIFVAGSDRSVVLDIESGQPIVTIEHPGSNSLAVQFSPDGKELITGDFDGVLNGWDAETGDQLWSRQAHDNWIWVARFSPDGKLLATGSRDTTAKIWDSDTGELLMTLAGDTASVRDLEFSPDGRHLATASVDGSLKLWDLSTGEQRFSVVAHQGAPYKVEFSSDGSRLLTSSFDDFTVRLFVVPVDDLVALVKSRISRSLTNAECQQYLHVDECP